MTKQDMLNARRNFLKTSSLCLASFMALRGRTALATQDVDAQRGGSKPNVPSTDTLMKFFADGRPRPFAGNTIICHLQQQCAFTDAVADFGRALQNAAVASKLAFLPRESYHLTVFAGATDQTRSAGSWPSDIPPDASIQDCNRLIEERLSTFHMECALPIRMRLDVDETIRYRGAVTLRMVAVDQTEERKIRILRDRIADVYRYRAKDHDTYSFHIGLAYRLAEFTAKEQEQYEALVTRHTLLIAESAPWLELGLPEFCTFLNMYRFNIKKLLRS